MNRIEEITRRLTEEINALDEGQDAISLSPMLATPQGLVTFAREDDTRLHKPFGFTIPTDIGQGKLGVFFCPEVIARQTEHLSDEDFVDYVNAIRYVLSLHVIWREIPLDIRVGKISTRLLEYAERNFRIFTDVQLHELDRTAAQS